MAAASVYTAASLAYFWPLPRVWGTHIGPNLGDPLFVLYVLKWGVHQIRLGLPDVWNANLFYPTRGALALSEHLLGPAAQLALFLEVIPNPIAGYNFLFVTSFIISAFAVCWVFRQSGLSWMAAALAGWMFAFSPFRLNHMSHLQILLAQWMPLTLWFWDRLLTRRTAKNAALFLLFYLLNLSGGCYLAYMIHFSLLVILVVRVFVERRALVSIRSLRVLVPVALIAVAAVAAIFLPYVRASRALGLTRSEDEIRAYSARLSSYFSPTFENIYFGPATVRFLQGVLGKKAERFYRPENSLFAGFLPTILFFVGAFAAWRRRHEEPPNLWALELALSGLLCFALSFALFYLPLARVVPGLSGMRVPPRFYMLGSLTVVYFAGRGVDVLLRRPVHSRTRAAIAAALAAALAVELAPQGIVWERLPREEELPAVYGWIRNEPDVKALLELPIYPDFRESQYLYASTVHWKPIANGYSGYMPLSHQMLTSRIRFLPGGATLELLRGWGISHLVVHVEEEARAKNLRRWERRFASGPERQVERVYQSEGISVYRLLATPARPALNASAGEVWPG